MGEDDNKRDGPPMATIFLFVMFVFLLIVAAVVVGNLIVIPH